MKETILIIDDDEKLNELLKNYLEKYGYSVIAAAHPEAGFQLLRSEAPHLIILDIMLPDMDGFEVCKRIRVDSSIPIIMLTARGEITDRVVGLEIGADDYMPKPFEPRELLARIQSVLRRSAPDIASKVVQFEGLTIDLDKFQVSLEERPIELSSTEFELLSLFARNPGKVLSRDRIMEEVHGIEWESYNRSVDVLVSRLRQKLGDDPKHPHFLKTVWGTGYLFMGKLT